MKELWNKHVFPIFLYGFRIKTSVYAWTCDKQPRTCEEHIRTIKNIQTYLKNLNNYYHALILNSHQKYEKHVCLIIFSISWI